MDPETPLARAEPADTKSSRLLHDRDGRRYFLCIKPTSKNYEQPRQVQKCYFPSCGL
jgi:hypothetical protein